MKKQFSMSRLLKTSYFYFGVYKKRWLKGYLSIMTLFLVFAFVDTLSRFFMGTSDYLYEYSAFSDFYNECAMYMLMGAFLGSTAMTAQYVNTKTARIGLFMLPSSNAEKFVTLVCMSSVLMFVLVVLGIVTADVLNYGLQTLLGFDNPSFLMPGVIDNFIEYCYARGTTGIPLYLSIAKTILIWVSVSSVFLFMVFALKRGSRTTMSVVTLLLVGTIRFLVMSKPSDVTGGNGVLASSPIITIVALLALYIFCMWASYRTFSRLQIVDNKLINL